MPALPEDGHGMKIDREKEHALRNRARKLQALHIRLLFCRRTREAWLSSPDDVLTEYGLSAADKLLFPDITSEQFKAESHGRRVVVERAIGNTFEATQNHLARRAAASGFSSDAPMFDEFLCSDFFLNPRNGLPHCSGVGPGYENISKYFFWMRSVYSLGETNANMELRNHAYTEFAIYLVTQYQRPHDPFYDQFQGGLYWEEMPGTPKPVILLSDKFVRYTLGNAETIAQLPAAGLQNLDQLAPLHVEDEATLV